jgi:16S rRNA U1498 N3-methylase RsmE
MPPRDGRAVLVGDEARHLARVMRCTVGDEVVVFDGSGTSWRARVASIGRDEVGLDLGEAVTGPRPARVPLTLAVALPKGERQKWLVEKLTELGVERLVPLSTTRGVAEATPAAVERLSRGVIEACKQCGRDALMQIGGPKGVAEVVGDAGSGTVLLVADRDGVPLEEIATAGIADALTLSADGRPDIVVDWKSDVNPAPSTMDHYYQQVRAYLRMTGARRGLIVLMTTSRVITVDPSGAVA